MTLALDAKNLFSVLPPSATTLHMSTNHATQTPAKRSLLNRIWSPSAPFEFAAHRAYYFTFFIITLTAPVVVAVTSWALGVPLSAASPWLLPIAPFGILMLCQILPAIPKHGAMRVAVVLRHMTEKLPWFHGQPATFCTLPGDDVLDQQLHRHGYQRLSLDGGAVRSWRDLIRALEAVTTPTSIIQDEPRYAFHLLAQLSNHRPRTALVWRNPEQSVAATPDLLANISAAWSGQAAIVGGGLLLLIDVPRDAAEAPATPAEAEKDAWWTPAAGELAR